MIAIINGEIETMAGRTIPGGTVLIDGGRIAAVGKDVPIPEGAQRVDAGGRLVLPGMIDAHSHIGMWEECVGFEGADGNELTDPITPHMRAIDGIYPMEQPFADACRCGVTAAATGPGSTNVIGGQFAAVKLAGRCIDDMVIRAPLAMKCALGENPKTYYNAKNMAPITRMGIAALLREALFHARQYLEQQKSGGTPPDFQYECYRDLFEGKIPLKAHVHRADDIFTAIRIAKEFGLGLTLDHCTEGHLVADAIAESGFPAIVGPSLASRSKIEVEQSDFHTPGVLHKAGVLIALTTDHPVTRIQYLPLCAALAAKEGLGEEAALRAVTIDAARICRVDDRLGSLRVGKDADLAIFDGSPLVIASRVRATVVGGRVVYRPRA